MTARGAADRDRRGWLVLGIDPGAQGAVALVRAWPGRPLPQLEELADAADLARVRALVPEADLVVVEGQQASPQQGRSSAYALGVSVGRLQEATEAGAKGRVVTVWPAAWKASYGLAGGKAGKAASVALVGRLLGGSTGAASAAAVQRHDEAEAVLLAWWGWRHVLVPGLAPVVQKALGPAKS